MEIDPIDRFSQIAAIVPSLAIDTTIPFEVPGPPARLEWVASEPLVCRIGGDT